MRNTVRVADKPDPESGEPDGRTGIIFDVKRYAVHDGPGIRTTVFLKGCPLRCRWCHNPESLLPGPEHSLRAGRCAGCGLCIQACRRGAISRVDDRCSTDVSKCVFCGACVDACPTGAREILGRRVTVEGLMAEIERDVIFFDQSGGGVTFSGGEPLVQAAFLGQVLRQCKAREIHTTVDTTCYAPWEVIEPISPHVDLYLCDLKHMDSAKHERFAGVSNGLILQNVRRLAQLNKEIIIRVPVIPGVNDDQQNVAATGEFVSSLGGVRRIDILPQNGTARAKIARLAARTGISPICRNGPKGAPHDLDLSPFSLEPPSAEKMESIARRLEDRGFTVKIGG